MNERDKYFIDLVDKILSTYGIVSVESIKKATSEAIRRPAKFYISPKWCLDIVKGKVSSYKEYPIKIERDIILKKLFKEYRYKLYPNLSDIEVCELLLEEEIAPRLYIEDSTAFRLYYRIMKK